MKTCSDKITPGSCCSSQLESMGVFNNMTYTQGKQAQVCDSLNSCVEKTSCVDFWEESTFDCKKFALNTSCCDTFVSNYEVGTVNETVKSDFCNQLVGTCQNNYLVSYPCMDQAWRNSSSFSCKLWTEVETDCLQKSMYI